MPLHLIIENETSLPDGGPLSYALTGTRGIDIGRDQYLDWTLPDPGRAVSGKHCEVRFRDGAYWLHDVSRNGTFVNQSAQRLQEPHRLRHGDRIYIGHYIIRAEIDGEPEPGRHAPAAAHDPQDPWGIGEAAAPPIPRRDLQPPRERRPVNPDFQDWRMDLPDPAERAPIAPVPALPPAASQAPSHAGSHAVSHAGSEEGMSWARGLPSRWPDPAPPPVPEPRRPAPPVAPRTGYETGYDMAPESAPARESGPFADPPRAAQGAWGAPPAPERGGPDPRGPDSPWGQPSLAVAPPRRQDFEPPPEPGYPPPRQGGPGQGGPDRAAPPAADDFVERFARGASIPAEVLAWRDPGELAEEIGALTRLAAENLKVLLLARAEAKRVARASSQTMIQALDNNPLKFTPTVDDALRIMFSRPVSGYLPARAAMEEGFRDLKTHQVKVYAAMQHALRLLLQDLDPEAVEASLGDDRGLSGLLGSRKARLWDVYATRWDALTAAHEEGMVDAFMVFFAECYDRGGKT